MGNIIPRISIIIPVYNVEKYLQKCLDSIIYQKCKDYEVILVDDGSMDSSGHICDEYANSYKQIRAYHIDNSGASHARNVGIEKARGEWICFVDSDDWVSNDYLNLSYFLGNEDIIFFPARQFFEKNDVICRYPMASSASTRKETEAILYRLKYGSLGDIFGWTWDKFFKKSIIDEHNIRFQENIVFREDEIFTMDYCRHIDSIRILETPLYYYRTRGNGLTANGMKDSDYLNLADNIERNLPYFQNDEFLRLEKQRLANYHIDLFLRKARLWNMYSAMDEVYLFFKTKPQFKEFSSNQQIVRLLSHSKIVSFLLLEVYHLLETLKLKL